MKILFVCTGNTCRSPMAEAIFNKLSSQEETEHFAFSKGTSVLFPQKTNPKALRALENFDVFDFEHTSALVSEEDILTSDLILTMTAEHKRALVSVFGSKNKIYTLTEKAYGTQKDISDPYGLDQEKYNDCAAEIYDAVERLICTL